MAPTDRTALVPAPSVELVEAHTEFRHVGSGVKTVRVGEDDRDITKVSGRKSERLKGSERLGQVNIYCEADIMGIQREAI